MAGSYNVLTQNREVQVLGPTEVIDVEKVGIITKPTGIYVEYPLPLLLWQTRAGSASGVRRVFTGPAPKSASANTTHGPGGRNASRGTAAKEIGRASCRERVLTDV